MDIQVRRFQETDSERIHQLFKEVMIYGAGSPGKLALNYQLNVKPAYVLYGTFSLGVLISCHSIAPGSLICVASFAFFLAWRQRIWREIKKYDDSAMNGGDLADIGMHYGPAPSAFWVAEVQDSGGGGTIIGCVGLDSSTNPDPSVVEIRRMLVSPSCQQRGVGTSLLRAAIEHARAQKMQRIFLSTSMFQPAARKLYERFGFFEEGKLDVGVKFCSISFDIDFYVYGMQL